MKKKTIEENKQKVKIKKICKRIQFIVEIMCTDKNNDENKTKLPPPLYNPVTVFLIAEKLLSL